MLTRKITPTIDQKRMKQMFEGSLIALNGGNVPISQQPILRSRQSNVGGLEPVASKEALAAAASSLAALWQISGPKRPHRNQ